MTLGTGMKRIIPVILTAALLCLAVKLCWPSYRKYKETGAGRRAAGFLAGHDLAKASVSARQALRLNPGNVEACRVMGELAELARSPAAVDWFQRVAELQPTGINQLRVAACALKFEHPPYPLASRTLAEAEKSLGALPAFHVLSAELELKLGRLDRSAAHFEKACRLDPTNRLHALNLAALDLFSTNNSKAQSAQGVLVNFNSDPTYGAVALRWLVADQMRRNQFRAAHDLSHRLLAHPRTGFDDRLKHLEILRLLATRPNDLVAADPLELPAPSATSSPGFDMGCDGFGKELEKAQAVVRTNLAALLSLSEWMGQHSLADEALSWLENSHPELGRFQPVALAKADLYLAKQDWPALELFLGEQKWREVDFLRLALLSRAAGGQQRGSLAQARWKAAVRETSGRLGALNVLLALSGEWRCDSAPVLWEILRRFPAQRWAVPELERHYAAAGDTWNLNRLYASLIEQDTDFTNRNNFAITSMLIGANSLKAHQVARELYLNQRSDPGVVSTYAYSLHLQQRTKDGLGVLRSLPAQVLETPAIALYYGVLLAADGDARAAGHYLALAQTAWLLPEERTLLTHATETLGRQL
jgi:tetratricopeptide (TPR) repeat protein